MALSVGTTPDPLPPLTTVLDVEARLERSVTEQEMARAEALITDAGALISGYCGRDFPEVPPAVAGVAAQVVARALTVPVTAYRTDGGPITHSGGPYLSSADKQALRSFRKGLSSVALSSERGGATRAWWLT